jgi:colicin import membrane protein
MSDTKVPRSRSKTRTEVQDEFSNLSAPQKLSQKERDLKAQHADGLRQSAADITAEKAAQSLASAGVAVQKSLSAVSEELTTRLAQLATVKANIELESADLQRLYGHRVVLEHLDVLMAEHDEKKAALEKEIADVRLQWDTDQAFHAAHELELDEELKKSRSREAAEYQYRTHQQRRADEDSFLEDLRVRKNTERDRREVLEKEWAARSATLLAAEQELTALRTAVASHPNEIDKATKQAAAIEANRLTREHAHAFALLERDRASEKALAAADKASLEQALARANKLVEELTASLASAHAKNAEIATKALDASSGASALSAVQSFAKDVANGGSAKRS